jgi:hypothetical protein
VRGYLVFVCAYTLVTAVHITRVPSNFTLDDWLINYEGGFVRRGLIGQVIFGIRHVLPVSGLYPAAAFALICYAVIFYATWRLISKRGVDAWVAAMVVCPATLAFAVIDNRAWGHKEVLFLAGLAGLLLWLMRPKQRDTVLVLGMALYCPFLILCHEPLVCFLPYYFAAVMLAGRSLKDTLKIAAIPMLLAAVTLAVVVRYPGTATTAAKICDSQGDPSRQLCQGAINYLGTPNQVARLEVMGDARRYHFHAMYSGLTLLAIIPFAMTSKRLWRYRAARYELIVLGIATALSCIASVVLFLYATDWGRWIYIHLLSVFLLLLYIRYRHAGRETDGGQVNVAAKWRLGWASAALFLYATSWSMPHWGNRPLLGYYSPVIRLVESHIHRAPSP